MAFYLTYRPQKIEDLDLPEVRKSLKGLLKKKELPHALLFTGIRGTGKTSSARILAKAINCESPQDGEPCNTCDVCKSITRGNSMDVIEMDAASHRGIDDIRELREKVKLAPSQLEYKVYIIDEVHMLTTEAFNALLKTLEEPPQRVIFVLCTTEEHKLPDTVRSRCVKIDFRKAKDEEIFVALQRIVKGEDLVVDEEALRQIAMMGDGSFRDATKILEEVSWIGDAVDLEILNNFYQGRDKGIEELVELIKLKKTGEALQWIESVLQSGANWEVLSKQLLNKLHQDLLQEQGDWDKRELIHLLELLAEYEKKYSTGYIPQLAVELAITDWIDGGSNNSVNDNVGPGSASSGHKQATVSLPPGGQKRQMSRQETGFVRKATTKTSVVSQSDSPPKVTEPVSDLSLQMIEKVWPEVMAVVKPINFSVEAFMRSARPKEITSEWLLLEVAYSFHLDKLQEPASQQVINQAIKSVVGHDLSIRCQLSDGQAGNKKEYKPQTVAVDEMPVVRDKPVVKSSGGTRSTGKKVANEMPVETQEDEALMQFAEELFGE